MYNEGGFKQFNIYSCWTNMHCKNTDRSQMNPKKLLYKTAFSVQLPYIAVHSLKYLPEEL